MKTIKVHKSLVTRITILAITTGFVVFCGLVAIAYLLRITTGPLTSTPWLQPALLAGSVLAIVLGIPLLIGWLSSRLIASPLKAFNAAIASLQTSDYKVQLPTAGITEFDKVFASFNTLTKRLHEEEKLRKDLISDTSHELNTPLTAIAGQLTAMQDGTLPMTKERIGIVKEQADRLTGLIDGLDAYTRARMPSTGKPEAVRLEQLCQELIDGVALELKDKNIQPELHIPPKLIIQADHKAIQQILQNLLQNALRYSEATKIIIKADEHRLYFTDNGKGVSADSLPYLFERFYRVEKSRSRATGGLGLGLAIVKELAERQDWTITAEPAKPGLGFVITF